MTTLIHPRKPRFALPLLLLAAPLLLLAPLLTACETRPPARPAPVEPSQRGTPKPADAALRQNEVGTVAAPEASCCPPASPRLLRVRRQASS